MLWLPEMHALLVRLYKALMLRNVAYKFDMHIS